MVADNTLRIPRDSELSSRLHEAVASGEALVVDTGEAVYRLDVAPVQQEWTMKRPTPEEIERSRAGIRASAGSWRDIDADAFKAYIRERRRSSNRPPVRL